MDNVHTMDSFELSMITAGNRNLNIIPVRPPSSITKISSPPFHLSPSAAPSSEQSIRSSLKAAHPS